MRPMPAAPDVPPQTCPACGAVVDVPDAEPLARIACPACGEMLRVERAFDHFIVTEMLGVGGMGSVYKARDTRLDRFVALKVLRKELSADPLEAARLEQEARATASINHPNVVQVYSAGHAHGQIYLVMELVDRGSLDDLMAEKTRVPEAEALAAGIQAARGLQAAHEKGLIHRDVKPANILFGEGQTAKIGDFGLAIAAEQKAEAQNEIWGTPYYVAPERLNNEAEDFRSDIYSLGATLFHAIAGQPPIEGETTSAAELRQLKSNPPDLRAVTSDVSGETARIIKRMLAPDPAKRFGSYAELIKELQRAANPSASDSEQKSRCPSWIPFAVLAIVALLGAGFFVAKREATPASSTTSTSTATPDNTAALRREEEARGQAAAREKQRIEAEAAQRAKAEADAREAARQKLLEQESPSWEKALADARGKIATYEFGAALVAIDTAKVTEPSLVEAQSDERKKMSWLRDWKATLIEDIRSGRFVAPVEVRGARYTGASKADDARITFKLPPYGTVDLEWTKIPPATLLAMSTSLIHANAADVADRQWLCAIFAAATGQSDAAHSLGEMAAKAKPEYREQMKLLEPAQPNS
jgi:serine/threonine protein kinase